MDNLTSRKQEANELRKKRDFSRALPIYRELWQETKDKFDGVGLLCCLRKLNLFDEAFVLADELIIKFPDFNWCRLEVVWTNLQGKLEKFNEKSEIGDVAQEAERIMKLEPEGVAKKKIVFRVLKSAKSVNRWDIVNEWVNKLRPEELSKEPIKDEKGREGWCDQSLWYNYYIKCLLENKEMQKAIELIDQILESFPKQKKFFLRFKAIAYSMQGKLKEAENLYCSLTEHYSSDWWLLHEHAKVLSDLDKKDDALKLMCKAAVVNQGKLETMVSLFEDMGSILKELGKYEESRAHFLLSKYVRTSKSWSLKESLLTVIFELKKVINKNNDPTSLQEALNICRSFWGEILQDQAVKYEKSLRRGLIGNLSLGPQERSFCFINIGNESFFCFKSDLPTNAKDGVPVIFDAKPSFDKKKNKDSWKATNIKIKGKM